MASHLLDALGDLIEAAFDGEARLKMSQMLVGTYLVWYDVDFAGLCLFTQLLQSVGVIQ